MKILLSPILILALSSCDENGKNQADAAASRPDAMADASSIDGSQPSLSSIVCRPAPRSWTLSLITDSGINRREYWTTVTSNGQSLSLTKTSFPKGGDSAPQGDAGVDSSSNLSPSELGELGCLINSDEFAASIRGTFKCKTVPPRDEYEAFDFAENGLRFRQDVSGCTQSGDESTLTAMLATRIGALMHAAR